MQDALFELGVAPSSTLAFIGSTQARSSSFSARRSLANVPRYSQATLEALLAIPISRLVGAYGPVGRSDSQVATRTTAEADLSQSLAPQRRVAIAGSLLASLGPILAGSCSHSVPGLLITEVGRLSASPRTAQLTVHALRASCLVSDKLYASSVPQHCRPTTFYAVATSREWLFVLQLSWQPR